VSRNSLLLLSLHLLHAPCALLFSHSAWADDPARVQLAAFRVHSVLANGAANEKLQTLEQIRPGDVIEYQATYANPGKAAVSNVQLTLPVPPGGVVYVPGGARPAGAMASIDGKVFAAMPLMRSHVLPDGRVVQRTVPASEIRFLRWDLGTVEAGAQRSVQARMQLPALPTQAAAPTQVAQR
jgi:uncharacterized repeat protein (TIGR01451 family)